MGRDGRAEWFAARNYCQFSASPVLFSEEAFGLAPTSDHLIVEPSSSLGPCVVPNLSKILEPGVKEHP